MLNIKTLNKISPAGLARLDPAKYRCSADLEGESGILVRSADLHDMEFAPTLRAIARAGAGTNNIPVGRCSEAGIVVFNTPGANANAVKEMVMAGLLLSARKIFPGMEWVQTLKGQGAAVADLVEKGKGRFAGPELKGKTLGIIGLGAIGIRVANLAIHFGMTVYGYDPYISVDSAWNLSRAVRHAGTLEEIYKNCDFITLHLPQTEQTKGMINTESLRSMRHGVRLVNFARGGLVVTEDLLEQIDQGQVRCYVTDFPDDLMLGHPGVLAMPHLAASTPESEENCARMAADQLVDYLENGNIVNSVNLPDVVMERESPVRIGCIHRNIPNMLAQISSAMSAAGINIDNLLSKSRKDYAYSLLDVTGEVDTSVIRALEGIDGMIRVNVHY